MNEQILTTKELRLRITQLEYESLSPEDYIKEIQRIYIEEIGETLPAEIEVFTSHQSYSVSDESEYKGTAIRFYSNDNNIDEVYIVSEGTQGLDDWLYNVEALVAGRSFVQVDEVNNFMESALEHFKYDKIDDNNTIPIIGLGHSQAHNTNATAYLIHEKFTSVYGVNGAQLNYYQLFHADENFREFLINVYPILRKDRNKIYTLNTDELKRHAINFYKDKAQNIEQDFSKQDPLYGVKDFRGFFSLGKETVHETNANYPGISDMFGKIDDDYLQQLQKIAVVYTKGSEKGDKMHVVDELLGVDTSFFRNFKLHHYATKNFELLQNIRALDAALPEALEPIYQITDNKESVLSELHDAGYISKKQKAILMDSFENIEKEIRAIEKFVNDAKVARDQNNEGIVITEVIVDVHSIYKVIGAINSITEELEDFPAEEFEALLDSLGKSHGIGELMESLSNEKRKYVGTELYIKNTKGSKDIWVSLSVTGRICGLGKLKLLAKEEKIEKFKNKLKSKVYEVFEEQRTRANTAVDYMEANPNIDREFLHPHGFSPNFNRTITRINVHEEIPRFEDTSLDMTEHIHKLNASVEKGHSLIQQYRETVESLFKEEDNIAEQIDFMEGMYING